MSALWNSWVTQFDSESHHRYLWHPRGGWKQLMLGCSSLKGCSWGSHKHQQTPRGRVGQAGSTLHPCRRDWEAGRPCASLGHIVALLWIFIFSPACVAWTALNPVQYTGFIILTDMLRVALTQIYYTVMPVRNKLPGSTEHPSLTPSEHDRDRTLNTFQSNHPRAPHALQKKNQNTILHSSPETFLFLSRPSPAAPLCFWSLRTAHAS